MVPVPCSAGGINIPGRFEIICVYLSVRQRVLAGKMAGRHFEHALSHDDELHATAKSLWRAATDTHSQLPRLKGRRFNRN